MTTHSRIAAFLSTSALCLGLVAAPSAFAAGADATTKVGEGKMQTQPKHQKADKSSAKASHAGQVAKADHAGTSPAK